MDKNIRIAYLAERTTGTTARYALAIARYNIKKQNADIPRYCGDSVRIELPRGECIVMRIEADNGCGESLQDRFGVDTSNAPTSEQKACASEGWQDRDGRVIVDMDNRGWHRDWRFVDCDVTTDYFRKQGIPRHNAWLAMRADKRRVADAIREALHDYGECGYVVELYDAAGDEIDSDSCWGFSDAEDCGMEALSAAESMMRERAKYWQAECASARNLAAKCLAEHRAILKEFRETAQLPDVLQDAIYGKLAKLRAAHKTAIRIITGE